MERNETFFAQRFLTDGSRVYIILLFIYLYNNRRMITVAIYIWALNISLLHPYTIRIIMRLSCECRIQSDLAWISFKKKKKRIQVI